MLEEVHIKSADLAVEGNTSASSLTYPSKPSTSVESVQKIYRQGDKIYQVKDENITTIKDGPIPPKTSTSKSIEPLDEIASGESLYKTFTFDNAISPEETEKCLTFWRSIVEKNLEPIKCTLIENATKLKAEADQNSKKSTEEKKRRSRQNKCSKEADEKKPNVPQTKRNIWFEVLTELQKKRIDQTKLLMEKRCRFCGYLSSPAYEIEKAEEQDKHFIKELANWEPTSYRKKSSRLSKKSFRTSTGSARRESELLPKKLPLSDAPLGAGAPAPIQTGVTPVEPIEETVEEKAFEPVLANIKEESKKIKHVDVIKRKKFFGDYSKWRKNQMDPCNCDRPNCDCNINPAIKAVNGASVTKVGSFQSKSPDSKGSKDSSRLGAAFKEKKQESEEMLPDPRVVDILTSPIPAKTSADRCETGEVNRKSGGEETLAGQLAKRETDTLAKTEEKKHKLSIEEPTNLDQAEVTSKTSTEKYPERASIQSSTRQDSGYSNKQEESQKSPEHWVEIYTDSSKDGRIGMSDQKRISEDAYSEVYSDITDTGSGYRVGASVPKRSILILRDSDRKHTNTGMEVFIRRQRRSSQKSLSVVVSCLCDNEKCDCHGVLALPEKTSISNDEDLHLPKPPKLSLRGSARKVNSLELIKRRLSTGSVQINTSSADEIKLSDDLDYDDSIPTDQFHKTRRESSKSVDSLELHKRRMSKRASIQSEESDENVPDRDRRVSMLI